MFGEIIAGSGNDLHVIDGPSLAQGAGHQFISINNQGDHTTQDRLLFGEIANGEDLAFTTRNSTDLAISISRANRQLVLQDWYGSPSARVDLFQLAGGACLRQADLQTLVQARQGFNSGLLSQAQWDATAQSLRT